MTDAASEHALHELAAELECDPYGFVVASFPWNKPGTPLANETGPRPWQADLLKSIGGRLQRGVDDKSFATVMQAVASGNGVGKSAVVAWLACWALTTLPNSRVLVSANTHAQLQRFTMPEITRWMRLSLFSHWFEVQSEAIFSKDPSCEKTWRLDTATWSEGSVVAYQGLHSRTRTVVLFDEASEIPQPEWNAVEGKDRMYLPGEIYTNTDPNFLHEAPYPGPRVMPRSVWEAMTGVLEPHCAASRKRHGLPPHKE